LKYIIAEDNKFYYLVNLDLQYCSTAIPKYQIELLEVILAWLKKIGHNIENEEILNVK